MVYEHIFNVRGHAEAVVIMTENKEITKQEIEDAEKAGKQEWRQRRQSSRNYLFDTADEKTQEYIEKVRLGEKNPDCI